MRNKKLHWLSPYRPKISRFARITFKIIIGDDLNMISSPDFTVYSPVIKDIRELEEEEGSEKPLHTLELGLLSMEVENS